MQFLKSIWLITRYIFIAFLLILPAILVVVLLATGHDLLGIDAYDSNFWIRVGIGIPVFYIFLGFTCGKYFIGKFGEWAR